MAKRMFSSNYLRLNSVFGWWRLVVLIYWSCVPASQAQQSYISNHQLDCYNNYSETNGYQCNGPTSCLSYLTYRSIPPYDTPRSISSLLNSDPSQIAGINQVPLDKNVVVDTVLIVPVYCSCSGDFYQHNAYYTPKSNDTDTYFLIANNTYQGLTACQALIAQNPFPRNQYLSTDMDVLIPLRCACPVDVLIMSGYNYLFSYLVTWGDSINSIAETFNVEMWTIFAANNLPYSDEEVIFPFTQILVPLKDPPTPFQTQRISNCLPHDTLVYEIF